MSKQLASTAVCLMVSLFFCAVIRPSHADLLNMNPIQLDADGNMSVPLRLESTRTDIAGVQGRVYFDPMEILSLTLTLAPEQPQSFVVKTHLSGPDQLTFVLYSGTNTLRPHHPIMQCRIEPKEEGKRKGFNSMLVYEREMVATADLQATFQPSYSNLPIDVKPRNAVDYNWTLY